ncbi:MAG: AmmeMemoRadiSam system protein A [Desulfovibrionaceae bacterium]|nr:AmmeMemoRadiSam system protein A [Desulfovibrionaceae bacterium]
MPGFMFNLSSDEKTYLKDLVKWTLLYYFERGGNPPVREIPVPPEGSKLNDELGAFVTLNKDGQLRGCIGQVVGRGPLYQTVAQMSVAAAFSDYRFPPLHADEMDGLEWEISVMGPILPCSDTRKIVIGRHGLVIVKDNQQGLLLPQVASSRNWTVEQFLENLCRKAGLEPEDWKAGNAHIYWFECLVI